MRIPLTSPVHRSAALLLIAPISFISALALGPEGWGSPPPIPRTELPRIQRQLKRDDATAQLQALSDLAHLEGNVTAELVPLVPRVIELTQSPKGEVANIMLAQKNEPSR